MAKVKPIRDQVLVKVIEGSDVTEGGLHLPKVAVDLSNKGKVIEVGGLVSEIAQYDTVIFETHAGIEVDVEGDKYLFLQEEDILAVVED